MFSKICMYHQLLLLIYRRLTPAECERAFRHFDKDGDGSIDSTEVIEVMRCAGQNPTLQMVDEMMAEADESGTSRDVTWHVVTSRACVVCYVPERRSRNKQTA